MQAVKPTKTCRSCGNTKTLVEFYHDARSKDGYMARCKDCSSYYRHDPLQQERIQRESMLAKRIETAGTYNRISDEDEESILQNAKNATWKHAEQIGCTKIVEYDERLTAKSGKRRPVFDRMMQDVDAGKIDIVISTSLSRLTRAGIGEARAIFDRLRKAGVWWHFTEQAILNVDANTSPLVFEVMITILAELDKDYRDRISRATKAAMRTRIEAGRNVGRHRKGCACPLHVRA